MVQKYAFGSPFETEAVTAQIPAKAFAGALACGEISVEKGFCYQCQMSDTDVI